MNRLVTKDRSLATIEPRKSERISSIPTVSSDFVPVMPLVSLSTTRIDLIVISVVLSAVSQLTLSENRATASLNVALATPTPCPSLARTSTFRTLLKKKLN